MANKALNNAKRAKKDEFYTRREDIERELTHYEAHFQGKTVYCNCDDPEQSEFWQFFVRNFWAFGLKKLIATHYEPDEANFSYKLELNENPDGQFYFEGPVKTQIPSNGDFRSACCVELLQEADIVVTNPPFSLFREYVAQLMEYGKKFVIIGSKNAITYKEIFPWLGKNKIWLGYGFAHDDAFFRIPTPPRNQKIPIIPLAYTMRKRAMCISEIAHGLQIWIFPNVMKSWICAGIIMPRKNIRAMITMTRLRYQKSLIFPVIMTA